MSNTGQSKNSTQEVQTEAGPASTERAQPNVEGSQHDNLDVPGSALPGGWYSPWLLGQAGAFGTPTGQPQKSLLDEILDSKAIATGVLFGILIVKALSVTYFNVTSSLAIISSVGLVNVVIGAIMSTLPLIGLIYVFMFITALLNMLSQRRFERTIFLSSKYSIRFSILLVLAFAVSFVLISWKMLVVLLAYFVVTCVWILLVNSTRSTISRIGKRNKPPDMLGKEAQTPSVERIRSRPQKAFRRVVTIGLSIFLLTYLLLPSMWLPAEKIVADFDKERITFTGFVINDGGDWYSVLDYDDRRVWRIRKDDLKTRWVCKLENVANGVGPSLYQAVRERLSEERTWDFPSCGK